MTLSPAIRQTILIVCAIFVADQATKHAVLYGLDFISYAEGTRRIEVLPFFDLVLVWNRGISYGLLQAGSDFERWLLVMVSIGLTLVLAWWRTQVSEPRLALAIAIIIGGALGNLVDRVVYGAVADFVLLHAFGFNWYVFNIADTAIVLGVALMAWDVIFGAARPESGPGSGTETTPGPQPPKRAG
jgi:signal peptidase II